MKKTAIIALAFGLLAGSLVAPVEAKKPKLNKGALSFYAHWDDDGAGGCEGPQYLSLADTAGDTSCGFIFQGAQEALVASGQGALTYSFPATEGLPFKLDAKKGLTGVIAFGHLGLVNGSVDVKIGGLTKKGGATILEQNFPFGPAEAGASQVDLDVDLAKELDGQIFESITLDITLRGVSPQAYVEMEAPATYIQLTGK